MSMFDDIEHQLSKMKRKEDESIEEFAKRLFKRQMEVYSANAGGDLYCGKTFDGLDQKTRDGWIEEAKKLDTQ